MLANAHLDCEPAPILHREAFVCKGRGLCFAPSAFTAVPYVNQFGLEEERLWVGKKGKAVAAGPNKP